MFTYTPSARGGYTTDLTAMSGRTFRVRVAKREVMNPSARGGAYRTEWQATHGDVKGHGDTRDEAVTALVRAYEPHGIVLWN